MPAKPIKVWIDLSNSPHPLLFAPVAERLEELGHDVLVTARDNAQTVELARRTWPDLAVIGVASPAGRLAKARTLAARIRDLRAWARNRAPDVALSHNSYAQIVAARLARIPAVTAMDFEHQPANHLAFRLATLILVPEAFPGRAARRLGAKRRKLQRYPGLKESLYLGEFAPDPDLPEALGLFSRKGSPLVVARTPPTRAIYHPFENALFAQALRAIGRQRDVRCVILARHPEQVRALREMDLPNCVVPDTAIDSRALMYEADLVVGAGGTMTREAALMGVPTFTVFAGAPPAVDRWLEREGMLRRLTDATQVAAIQPRPKPPREIQELREMGLAARELFARAAIGATAECPTPSASP